MLDERLRAIAGQADIAVVPEMFATGFCPDRPGLAEAWKSGPVCQALQSMADTYHLAIIGSMMCYVPDEEEQAAKNTYLDIAKALSETRNKYGKILSEKVTDFLKSHLSDVSFG